MVSPSLKVMAKAKNAEEKAAKLLEKLKAIDEED